MNKSVRYTGQYRGISWEILGTDNPSWEQYRGHKVNWCHYIYINLKQVPEDKYDDFWLKGIEKHWSSGRKYIAYDYMDSLINSLDWHIGCTFYSKVHGFDGDDKIIKAGCDYQHYWDEDKEYNFEDVLFETKQTIDSLHELVPVSIFCNYGACDKTHHLESEGEYNEDKSHFTCLSCAEQRKIQAEKYKKECELKK